MKKLFTFLLTFIICFGLTSTAYALEEETTQNMSTPRLMVSEAKTEKSVKPGESTTLCVTLKNYSKSKAIYNIKLSVTDDSGDIKPVNSANKYVEKIGVNSTYKWEIELTASSVSQIGEHLLTVSSEYEDEYFNSYSGSDIVRVNVEQTVDLEYSGVILPKTSYVDETETMDISLMNTGKSNIRNCIITLDSDNLQTGGALLVGEIPTGEQKSTKLNIRVGKELGDTEATVTITYEDEFGNSYSKQETVSTNITEKPVAQTEQETEEKSKYPLWWLFMIIGLLLGGTVGCIIPIAIHNNKQRKQDELRL